MPSGSLQGRARTSVLNPQAKGLCDMCGQWWQLDALLWEMQWRGATLERTGYRVCGPCLDKPQEQLRSIILPPDPYPRQDPRPDSMVTPPAFAGAAVPTTPGNQGFTQYVLGAATPGNYPTTAADVKAAVATLSGIPTPGGVVDRSITITSANATLALMSANPLRTWLLIYNPSVPQIGVNTDTAVWGLQTNLMLGPGEALFWATAQGLGDAYAGALTAIGLTPGVRLMAFEAA